MATSGSWRVLAMCAVMCCAGCGGDEDSGDAADRAKMDVFGNGQLDSPCEKNWHCSSDDGLVCRPPWDAGLLGVLPESRCLPRSPLEGTCLEDAHCLDDLICVGADAPRDKIGTCVQRSIPGGDNPCSSTWLDCTGDLVCRPRAVADFYAVEWRCLPRAAEGGPCLDTAGCAEGLVCRDAEPSVEKTGTCSP